MFVFPLRFASERHLGYSQRMHIKSLVKKSFQLDSMRWPTQFMEKVWKLSTYPLNQLNGEYGFHVLNMLNHTLSLALLNRFARARRHSLSHSFIMRIRIDMHLVLNRIVKQPEYATTVSAVHECTVCIIRLACRSCYMPCALK